MGHDVIDGPPGAFEILAGGAVLVFVGHFLGEPRFAANPVDVLPVLVPLPPDGEQRVGAFENRNLAAAGPAHRKEALAVEVEYLPALEQANRRADAPCKSAVPLLHRTARQERVVLVVPGDEQRRKGAGVEPVEKVVFLGGAVPDAAEVAADKHVVALLQAGLFRKGVLLEAGEIAVGVAREIECHSRSPLSENGGKSPGAGPARTFHNLSPRCPRRRAYRSADRRRRAVSGFRGRYAPAAR